VELSRSCSWAEQCGQHHLSGASPVHSFLSSSIAFYSTYIVTLGGNAGRDYGSDQRDKDWRFCQHNRKVHSSYTKGFLKTLSPAMYYFLLALHVGFYWCYFECSEGHWTFLLSLLWTDPMHIFIPYAIVRSNLIVVTNLVKCWDQLYFRVAILHRKIG